MSAPNQPTTPGYPSGASTSTGNTGVKPVYIGIDPGTRCGWAVLSATGEQPAPRGGR